VQTTAFPEPPTAVQATEAVRGSGISFDELYRLVLAQQEEIDALKKLVDDLRRQ
jgi:hypothetical protein